MNASSFVNQFSLDYLKPSSTPAPSSSAGSLPPGLEAVLAGVSAQLVRIMRVAPEQTATLLDLARASSMRLEALLPVVQYLSMRGEIQRVEEDPTGNDTYRLTGTIAEETATTGAKF